MNERDWIESLKARVPPPAEGLGIGDDCAVLPGGLVVTADSFVEGIHFRTDWASWRAIGRKAAEAALSDVAAMGGEPLWMLASLSTARGAECAPDLLEGILEPGVTLVGGDTTGAPEGATMIALTVLGRAPRPVLRSGARPGDRVYVSGPLGGARAGLRSLERGLGLSACEERFLAPRARRDLAASWGRLASAMIDISDGLSSELHHIADASDVRILLRPAAIPLFTGAIVPGEDPVTTALASGEEFELLATSPVPLPDGIEIGVVEEGRGVHDGKAEIPRGGYVHWR